MLFKWQFCCLTSLLLCCGTAYAQPGSGTAPRPTNLDGFVNVNSYNSLGDAIANESKIYLPPGEYLVDGPITVNRTTPLFLFGTGDGDTPQYGGGGVVIRWNTGTEGCEGPSALDDPLFVVERVPRFSVWGIKMISNSECNGVRAFDFVNTAKVIFDIQESSVNAAIIDIRGRVTATMQQFKVEQYGAATNESGVILDHPLAELYLIGAGGSGFDYHYDQRRGHLEAFGFSSSYQGVSDFRIKTPSPKGTHVIAAVRSEGTNTPNPGGAPSRLLTVPESTDAVDVVVKSAILQQSNSAAQALISYEAAGTLWVMASGGAENVDALVDGDASGATIVAIGNVVTGGELSADGQNGWVPPDILPVTGATKIYFGNIYDFERACEAAALPNLDCETLPRRRFWSDAYPEDYATVPVPPDNASGGSIPKLDRPVINDPPPSGLLVDVTTHEDYPDIQAIIDDVGPRLYFPPGTYHIAGPLVLKNRNGGLIAGAGSSVTKIVSSNSCVFHTDGVARVTIQGISFEGTSGEPCSLDYLTEPSESEAEEAVFAVQKTPSGATKAPTANSFYDIRFSGGGQGLAMAPGANQYNCAETMIVDSEFSECELGFATGQWNAHNQWLHGVTFTDNEYDLGALDGLGGGSWHIFSGTATGTGTAVTKNLGAGTSIKYYNDFTSDGPKLFEVFTSSAPKTVFFDHCAFDPGATPGDPYARWEHGGGPIFLRSEAADGEHKYGAPYASAYIISIDSDIANWETIDLDDDSRKFEID